MTRRFWLLAGFGVLFAALAWIGYTLHFTNFMLYDDEGYVLITLRDFGAHGGLYEKIFSQYGPVFYLFYDGLHRLLDFAWTNTSGRWITLVNWLGTAATCSWLVHRARGWWPLTLFTFANVFSCLWIMIHEPMHPGSTITLWVALAACLGFEALRVGNLAAFAGVLGAFGAALALVKINVGAFLIFSTGAWLLLAGPARHDSKIKLGLILLGLVLPVALMRTLLVETWIQIFVAVSASAIIATLFAILPAAGWQPATKSTWWWFIGCGLGVTVVSGMALAFRGTPLGAMWEGVFVAPLKHPTVYSFPVKWRPGVLALSGGALLLTWWAQRRSEDVRVARAIAWIRIGAVLLLQIALLPRFAAFQAGNSLSYGIPLVGLFAWPLLKDGAHRHAAIARGWLALVLVFQMLHAYPVAGSQINWGTFLWIPLMLLGTQEAVEFLCSGNLHALRRAKFLVGAIAITMIVTILWTLGWHAYQYRNNGEFLEVPGAEKVQLPEQVASAIRVITENAHVHADTLFSLPGAYSLNLWSGVKTPTLANVTHWFSLLSPAQQKEMLSSLEAAERPVFVVQHNILAALIDSGFRPDSPVLDYVRNHYSRAFAVEGYSFWVRNGRTIAPLSTGQLRAAENAPPHRMVLDLTVAARPGAVATIEIWNVTEGYWPVLTLRPDTTQVALTPLGLDNRETGDTTSVSWPFALPTLSRVSLTFSAPKHLPPAGHLEAILRDQDGKRMGYVRILPDNGFALPAFNSADALPPKAN